MFFWHEILSFDNQHTAFCALPFYVVFMGFHHRFSSAVWVVQDFIDGSIDWLIGLIVWFVTYWLIECMVDWLIDLIECCFAGTLSRISGPTVLTASLAHIIRTLNWLPTKSRAIWCAPAADWWLETGWWTRGQSGGISRAPKIKAVSANPRICYWTRMTWIP